MMTILCEHIVLAGGGRKYLQISHGIQRALAAGSLQPGDRLPPQRELADSLGVTLGTVTRAYRELDKLGLVRGETGRGTFIARREVEEFTLHALHNRMQREGAGIIRFDLNFPVPEAAPDLAGALVELSRERDLGELLRYQPTSGLPRHRQAASTYLSWFHLHVDPGQVVITTGAQHAIFTALASRLVPGDCLAVDEYTYPGILNVAGRLHLRLIPVAGDTRGMRPDELETAYKRHGVKGVYLIPTMHNPTTVTMDDERRRELAATIRRCDLFLVEDDVYGWLEEEIARPMSRQIPERCYYVNSFSKSLAPGLRVGYLTVPPGELAVVERVLAATTWMNPPLVCEIGSRWIEDGTLEKTMARKKEVVRQRNGILVDKLGSLGLTCRPTGLHGWLELPPPWSGEMFARQAAAAGVQVVPSSNFATHGHSGIEAVRICIGPPENEREVRRGAELLAALLTGNRIGTAQIM